VSDTGSVDWASSFVKIIIQLLQDMAMNYYQTNY
jgi:hypothetical protein